MTGRELKLAPTSQYARILVLQVTPDFFLPVYAYASEDIATLAAASDRIHKWQLYRTFDERPFLAVGPALFPLTMAEADQVEEAFGGLGLAVAQIPARSGP